uniref:Protein kinase domain-containing protein n=1 Tax=Tetradesmus obliquus TaxID=3088 RepID=A0A383VIX9_TETOB|eukprot:jgi/Sobl393_1/18543/SZX64702.1
MLQTVEEASPFARLSDVCNSKDDASRVSDDSKDAASAEVAAVPRTSLENWCRASKAIMPTVAVSRSFKTLRDMVGPEACIDPSCITKIKHLAEGGFATVELCWYQPPGSPTRVQVAVKRLKKELYGSADDTKLFAQEVNLMRKLRHRNIVDFIGVVEGDGYAIVQELMTGGNMKQLVWKHMMANGGTAYTLAEGLDICLQMARGLKYLHSCQPMVIHRDLKLENVLLNVHSKSKGGRFEVKLADFGLSKCVEETRQTLTMRRSVSSNASRLEERSSSGFCELDSMWSKKAEVSSSMNSRRAGVKAPKQAPARDRVFELTGRTGSLMYMSPEVFREQPYSEKADVFSFGVMMYEVMHRYIMLSAVSVNGTYEELEQYAARVAAGYRPPLHSNIPVSITSIIQDCMSADPLSRPTMEAVVSRLEAAAAAAELEGLDKPGCSCAIC